MSQDEWDVSTDPQAMLAWLHAQGKLSPRKAGLFAAACCRRIWHLLTDERSRLAVDAVERFADDRATSTELLSALDAHVQAESTYEFPAIFRAVLFSPGFDGRYDYREAVSEAAAGAAYAETPDEDHDAAADLIFSIIHSREQAAQADLLRDIVNPFRLTPPLNASLLTPDILALAQSIYDARATDRFPELASALEAAGCDDAELLRHLREGGPHAGRGCWE